MALPLPVADLVDECNLGPLDVRRPAAPTQDALGDYSVPSETVISVNPITWHPVTGRALESLPEADRANETRRFYARVALLKGDRIELGGRTWRVVLEEEFYLHGGVYMALAQMEAL